MEVVSSTSTGREALDELGRHRPARAAARPRPPRRRRPRRARARAPRALAGDGDRPDLEHAGRRTSRKRPSGSAPTAGCRRPRSPSSCGRPCARRSPRRPERRGQSSRGGVAEDDPLELGDRGAAEAQDGLEPLGPELARVERAAQLVDGRAVLLGDLVARDLEEDQVARALGGGGHPHEASRAPRAPTPSAARTTLSPACRRLATAASSSWRARSSTSSSATRPGEQRPDLVEREQRALVLEHALGEAVALGGRGADDDDEAAGRVAQAVGGPQDARADRDVARPRRAVPARPVGGPRPALVVGDLHAAGAFGS